MKTRHLSLYEEILLLALDDDHHAGRVRGHELNEIVNR